jgi:predicted lipid-binding transport protein (Tim44 family)
MRRYALSVLLLVLMTCCASVSAWARGGGGCFLPETPVLKSDGSSVPISELKHGDKVTAFDSSTGGLIDSEVVEVIPHDVDSYFELSLGEILLRVTGEHPFYVGNGAFKTVDNLRQGDLVYLLENSILVQRKIDRLDSVRWPATVYDLKTREPHTFFASGVAVHNKGGGGGGGGHGGGFHSSHYSGSSGGSNSCRPGDTRCKIWNVVPFLLFFALFILFIVYVKKGVNEENLDFTYSEKDVSLKARKTLRLLEFISKQDEKMNTANLSLLTKKTFLKLQECWQAREYSPMKSMLMPDLFAQHCNQLLGLVRNHEINVLKDVSVSKIDLVNVRYTEKADLREFTALVTASGTDHYIDDRTGKYLRGDREPAAFQEFWTFQLHGGTWLLREIEQTRESDALKNENFCEPFTDKQVEAIYKEAVDKLGPTGPWLEGSVLNKATKTERMLNFLVQTDKLWNRQMMLDRAREIFCKVHLALEYGELDKEAESLLFPAVAGSFLESLKEWKTRGETIEYRNFCVRKVELLLVRNYSDNTKDEYVARIRAHAQRVHKVHGNVLKQDPDVRPFEEYWTFGRLDKQWKLKEALPASAGEKTVDAENIDEETSADMVKWYYTKKRA